MEQIVNKKCKICQGNFPLTKDFFYQGFNKKVQKFYYSSYCINCERNNTRQSYTKREKIDKKLILWNCNQEKQCKTCKSYFPVTKEYFYKNSETFDGFENSCKDCRKCVMRQFYVDNHTIIREQKNSYRKTDSNRQKIKDKRKNDPLFALEANLRNRIRNAVVKIKSKKADKFIKLLGCSLQQIKDHLESKFQDKMVWENYGKHGWHVDHIIPCSAFDLSTEENQRICFNWINLQPLWGDENSIKNDKMPNGKYVENCTAEELDFYINELKEKIKNSLIEL